MDIYETYSQRQKNANRTSNDVFVYDKLPEPLRIQVCRAWEDALSYIAPSGLSSGIAEGAHRFIATELGLSSLSSNPRSDFTSASYVVAEILRYFRETSRLNEALDILEMLAVILCSLEGRYGRNSVAIALEGFITEANRRFMQHGIGYALLQSPSPQLIRKDSEHLHSEVVIPALTLLNENGFDGANEEYRRAHKHYREGNYKECLSECLKAFESTMKIICSQRGWAFNQNDTAKPLIATCLDKGLLPNFMQTHLAAVRSSLESAVPTVRNKLGGHGQGAQPIRVPQYYAEYLLHETATTIVFLVDAFRALPK